MATDFFFNPLTDYYIASDTAGFVWSISTGAFIADNDATYLAWVASGGVAPTFATAADVYAAVATTAGNEARPAMQSYSISSDTSLTNPLAWYIQVANTGAAAVAVKLPQANLANSFPLGLPLTIKNVSTTHAINIQRSDATNIISLAPDDYAVIITTSFATATGLQTSYKLYNRSLGSRALVYPVTVDGAQTLTTTDTLTDGLAVIGQTGGDPVVRAGPGLQRYQLTAVDFNSANTDNAIAITLNPGSSRYRVNACFISGASHDLSTATCGLFTAAAAGGTAIVTSGTAITVTATTEGTNANMQSLTINNGTTQSWNLTTLYFRVQTPEGAAATGNVTLDIQPL